MRLFTGKLYQTYNIFITTDVITFYQRAWLITKIFLLIPPEGQLCDRRPFSTLRECGAGGRFQDRGWREAAGTMALGATGCQQRGGSRAPYEGWPCRAWGGAGSCCWRRASTVQIRRRLQGPGLPGFLPSDKGQDQRQQCCCPVTPHTHPTGCTVSSEVKETLFSALKT